MLFRFIKECLENTRDRVGCVPVCRCEYMFTRMEVFRIPLLIIMLNRIRNTTNLFIFLIRKVFKYPITFCESKFFIAYSIISDSCKCLFLCIVRVNTYCEFIRLVAYSKRRVFNYFVALM